MLNLGNIERPERPKKMALSTEEINKINGLYSEIDVLKAENALLRDDLFNRFDKIEELITDLACKCGHESTKTSSAK